MRRIALCLPLVVAVILVFPTFAAASHVYAVGGGETTQGTVHFTVSAHQSHQTSKGPSGYVTAKFSGLGDNPSFTLEGPVTCLTVSGSRADVGIRIKKATGAAEPFIGNGFFLFLEDNGGPGAVPPDLFANSGFESPPQQGQCSTSFQPVFPVTKGNVVISSDGSQQSGTGQTVEAETQSGDSNDGNTDDGGEGPAEDVQDTIGGVLGN